MLGEPCGGAPGAGPAGFEKGAEVLAASAEVSDAGGTSIFIASNSSAAVGPASLNKRMNKGSSSESSAGLSSLRARNSALISGSTCRSAR